MSLTPQGSLGDCDNPGWSPIQQSASPSGPWTNATQDLIGHPILVRALASTIYYFRMEFFATSNCAGGVTSTIEVTTPSDPKLSVSNVTASSAVVSWTDPAYFGGAVCLLGYYLSEVQGPAPGPLGNTTDPGDRSSGGPVQFEGEYSAVLRDLTPGTAYGLEIASSIGNDGSPPSELASANSSMVNFTTSATSPSSPTQGLPGLPASGQGVVSPAWVAVGIGVALVATVAVVVSLRLRRGFRRR